MKSPRDTSQQKSTTTTTNADAGHRANDAATEGSGVTEETGQGFVNEVRKTLDQLVVQLDGVDPRKLRTIRLGGELRGLLGKAQDEFHAYESAFLEHAGQVGVSIALQNFSASLIQVFDIIARLQTAKFLLNKKFKREVLFAFQEINSYYTSLFMELSMAVAKRSGIVLPLPSPVKPQPPAEEDPVPPPPAVEVVEEVPEPPKGTILVQLGIILTNGRLTWLMYSVDAPPSGDMLCLEAHHYFFGHRKEKDLTKASSLYKVRGFSCIHTDLDGFVSNARMT